MSETARRTTRLGVLAWPLLLAPCVLANGPAAAQDREDPPLFTVEGEVLDAATGVPVEAAIVSVIGQSVTDVSNQLGYFRLEEIPAGSYAIRVLRLGYQTLEEGVSIEGEEVLTIHLTPGPVPLRGIEVEVSDREDIEWRALGTSSRGIVTPLEMEELRERYFDLGDVLVGRRMPRASYRAPSAPNDVGCLEAIPRGPPRSLPPRDRWSTPAAILNRRPAAPNLVNRRCAAIVLDGMLIDRRSAGWLYEMSTHDIFRMRYLHGPAATLRYGRHGADGVLIIETRLGR